MGSNIKDIPGIMSPIPLQEQCQYCFGWYPAPVNLHHSEDECLDYILEHDVYYEIDNLE